MLLLTISSHIRVPSVVYYIMDIRFLSSYDVTKFCMFVDTELSLKSNDFAASVYEYRLISSVDLDSRFKQCHLTLSAALFLSAFAAVCSNGLKGC